MELRQLRYFVAVAEELNFSRAAHKVHLSQPALSRQVARLEQELGVRLLHRTTHDVSLSDAGTVFFNEARKLLVQCASAVEAAQRASRGETGVIRVGFFGSALYSFLPRLLRDYRQEYPDVHLSLTQLTITQQVEALHNSDIDVGVILQDVVDPGISTRCVLKEPFVVAIPLDHPFAARKTIALKSLSQMPFVIFSRTAAPAIYDQTLRMCERAGFSPHVVQEARPMATVVGLVAAGLGIAIVPASMEHSGIEHVVYRPLVGTSSVNSFYLAWERGNDAPVLAQFLAMVKPLP